MKKLLVLLLGIALGLALALTAPRFWQRLLPQGLKGAPVDGVVEQKRWEEDHLLLTLVTNDGAVLATFRRKVPEIDLLVAPGDTVSLGLRGYRPFVEDPEIVRVVKAEPKLEPLPVPGAFPEPEPFPVPVPPDQSTSPPVEESPPSAVSEPPVPDA